MNKNSKGTFILSLDTELAWGNIDKPISFEKNKKYYYITREKVIDALLKLMEEYDIKATWALVGHLFLESCGPWGEIKHPEIPRSPCSWYKKDWFSLDPGTNINEDPIWYGRDIIEKIIRDPVEHEIASHSFSHLIFNEEMSKSTVKADLQKCVQIAKEMDIDLKSFIFPRHIIGFLEELNQAGFKAFRGGEPTWYSKMKMPALLVKFSHIIDQTLAISPPVVSPGMNAGMVEIPRSMQLLPKNSFRFLIPNKSRKTKALKGIRKAVKEKKIFHFWFHPYNIATSPRGLLNVLEEVFKEVNYYRKKDMIDVKTVAEVTKEYLQEN